MIPAISNFNLKEMKVFFVEDEIAQRELWYMYFSKVAGLDIQIFDNPIEAQSIIEDTYSRGLPVDVLITDEDMAILHGVDLIDNVHRFCQSNDLRPPFTILVSALDKRYLRNELDSRGFTEIPVLQKKELATLRQLVLEHHSNNTPEG